jgi:hypothetical protein
MILRRISENLRSQNWFAVIVELVIVVVGVFMGLQVQDWNEVRKERIEERELLGRLYEETLGLLETQRQELASLRARADILVGVNPVLFSQEPLRDISGEECAGIAGSHVFRRPPDELPVLDEMLATGRFDMLQDTDIKAQLRSYVLFRGRGRAYYQEATNELFRLHSRFPDLIEVGRVPVESAFVGVWQRRLSGEGFRWNPVCDAEKMRASTAFLNEYVDNLSRMGSLIEFTEARQEHLERLETTLSVSLASP